MTNRIKENTALSIDKFKEVLKAKGLKATPQRIAVHEAMLHLGHASADMVAEYMAQSTTTNITVASVYNILTGLSDLKIYHRRLSSNNKMYFDVNTFRHIHLYDRVNNEYRDIIDDEILSLIEKRMKGKRFRGYTIEDIDIQIICQPTRARRISH